MQQGCLNKSLLFLLVLSLVLCLVACDLSAIVNELKDLRNNNNADSSVDTPVSENVIISDSTENDFSIEIVDGTSTLVTPGDGSSLIYFNSDSSEEAYYLVDGNVVTADGTVIGKVEVLESEGKFAWTE
jgi:hypothetical protein